MVDSILKHLDELLHDAISRWNIPGATLAVLHNGQIVEAAAGLANLNTGIPVTPDTLFPYGSVTKVLTATMILRLVEEGKVELDAPVTQYVPEFKPELPSFDKEITVRRLLSHNSGLVGTIFKDTGRGEDAQSKNIALINEHAQYIPPGKILSYCNSGLLLLGRITECITGQSWHQAFQSVLAQPLGISSMVTRPEDALRHRFSVGHVRGPDAEGWQVAPYPFIFPSHGPAGSTPSGRARDLLTVVEMYMGIGENTGFLSNEVVSDAWNMQCESPVSFLQAGWGLGWSLYDWKDSVRLVGHDGSTMATSSYLRVDPDRKTAVALIVNSTNGLLVYDQVCAEIFRSLTGEWEPGIPASSEGFVPETNRYEGVFEDLHGRVELKADGDGLRILVSPNSANQMPGNAAGNAVLHNFAENEFYTIGEVSKSHIKVADEKTDLIRPYCICVLDSGEEFFHNGILAFKRVK